MVWLILVVASCDTLPCVVAIVSFLSLGFLIVSFARFLLIGVPFLGGGGGSWSHLGIAFDACSSPSLISCSYSYLLF